MFKDIRVTVSVTIGLYLMALTLGSFNMYLTAYGFSDQSWSHPLWFKGTTITAAIAIFLVQAALMSCLGTPAFWPAIIDRSEKGVRTMTVTTRIPYVVLTLVLTLVFMGGLIYFGYQCYRWDWMSTAAGLGVTESSSEMRRGLVPLLVFGPEACTFFAGLLGWLGGLSVAEMSNYRDLILNKNKSHANTSQPTYSQPAYPQSEPYQQPAQGQPSRSQPARQKSRRRQQPASESSGPSLRDRVKGSRRTA